VAASVVVGALSGTGTTGDKVISGLTNPKAIVCWATNRAAAGTSASTDPANFTVGAGTFRASTVSQWCAGASAESGDAAVSHTGNLFQTDAIIKLIGNNDHDVATPTIDFELDLVSMDATSVTLNVANAYTGAVAVIVNYMIFCGSDFSDALASTFTGAGSSPQDVTVVAGFGQPDLVMFAGTFSAATVNGNQAANLMLGWANRALEMVSQNLCEPDGAANMALDNYQRSDRAISFSNIAGAVSYDGSLAATAAWPTDGFEITWNTGAANATDPIGYLALKGTFQSKITTFTSPVGTGNQDTAVGFDPIGAMFWGGSQVASATVTTANTTAPRLGSQFIGAADGTTEASQGWSNDDANANARNRVRASTTQAVEMQSNSGGTVTISGAADASFAGNNVRLNWTATVSGRELLLVAIGAAAVAAATSLIWQPAPSSIYGR
jgi:hypothetical protein